MDSVYYRHIQAARKETNLVDDLFDVCSGIYKESNVPTDRSLKNNSSRNGDDYELFEVDESADRAKRIEEMTLRGKSQLNKLIWTHEMVNVFCFIVVCIV